MSDGTRTVGFMDVGTNSIHILVVRFFEGCLGSVVYQDKEVVRLGQSLYRDGRIDDATIAKSKLVTDRFTATAKGMGADEVIAFATCAARDASNRMELLEALDSEGLDVRVITGQEEARLIRLGVLGDTVPKENTLLIDVGGGSTEISLNHDGEVYLDSLAIGAVRYAYGFPFDPCASIDQSEYDLYCHGVDMESYRASRLVSSIGFTKAIGSSGGMLALADLCASRRDDNDNSYFTRDELIILMDDLRRKTATERAAVPRMSASRADIIVATGAIVDELMFLFGIERIDVIDRGLKEGMQTDYLLNRGVMNVDVRESSVMTLANRCQYDKAHADDVFKHSMELFDITRSLGLHSMGGRMRSLLGYAAKLHDIGEFFTYTKHNVISSNIIQSSELLGFDSDELNTIALMVRFHHRKFPKADDIAFADVRRQDVTNILRAAMLLRIADVLDRHRMQLVGGVEITFQSGTVSLKLVSDDDISMEVWKLESMRDDFERVFGVALTVVDS